MRCGSRNKRGPASRRLNSISTVPRRKSRCRVGSPRCETATPRTQCSTAPLATTRSPRAPAGGPGKSHRVAPVPAAPDGWRAHALQLRAARPVTADDFASSAAQRPEEHRKMSAAGASSLIHQLCRLFERSSDRSADQRPGAQGSPLSAASMLLAGLAAVAGYEQNRAAQAAFSSKMSRSRSAATPVAAHSRPIRARSGAARRGRKLRPIAICG